LNFLSLYKRKLIYKFKKKTQIDKDNFESNSLDTLFHYYGSDKANIFKISNNIGHGYSKFYEKKLEKFKDKEVNVLEIGSFAGSSAAAFSKYLKVSKIFCFDVNISNFKFESKKIHVFGININDKKKIIKLLNSIFKNHKIDSFDLIIDDGSHNLSDIIIGLKLFFKFVKNKGLYVIEDFKHPNYYKNNKNIDHILIDELLKNLKNKKTFFSPFLTRNEQEFLMNSIEKIEIFKGNLDDSDICFITKK